MTSAALGGCVFLFVATLTILMGGVLEAVQLCVGHVLVMAGGTFCFLACYIGSFGAIGILGVMASITFLAVLMRLVREMRGFLSGVAQGHLSGSGVTCHADASNGAGKGKGKGCGTDNHLFHHFPLNKKL